MDESSVLLLIGNKRDVSHGEREVSVREGEKLAEVCKYELYGFMWYYCMCCQ